MKERHGGIGAAQHVRVRRRFMARRACRFAVEQTFAASRGGGIKASGRWSWCKQTQLVVQECGQFRCHPIWFLRDGETDPGIAEVALPAHLRDADIAVPVRDRAIAGVSFEPDALQPVDWWEEHWQRGAVQRNDVEAVERMVSWVVSSGSPGAELGLGRVVQRWGQAENRTDIQIAVWPSIEAPADAARERVVYGGVSQRASRPDADKLAQVVDFAHHPYHGIEPQECNRHGGIGQVDLSRLERSNQCGW